MNREETQALISMGMAMYPATYAPPVQIVGMIGVWMDALTDVSASDAREAFVATSRCSPDRFPSLPKVLETLEAIKRNRPDPDKAFRDSHGGKGPKEWSEMEAWRESEAGKKRLTELRDELKRLFRKEAG